MNVLKSFGSALTRDLGEFAHQVQTDIDKVRSTKGGDGEPSNVLPATGDEHTTEASVFRLTSEQINELQELSETFVEPLAPTEAEENALARTVSVPVDSLSELLNTNAVLRKKYDDLCEDGLNSGGSITADVFWTRYFYRLQRLRKEKGMTNVSNSASQDRKVPQQRTQAGGISSWFTGSTAERQDDPVDDDLAWECVDDSPAGSKGTTPAGLKPSDRGTTSSTTELQTQLIEKLMRRVADLEQDNAELRDTMRGCERCSHTIASPSKEVPLTSSNKGNSAEREAGPSTTDAIPTGGGKAEKPQAPGSARKHVDCEGLQSRKTAVAHPTVSDDEDGWNDLPE